MMPKSDLPLTSIIIANFNSRQFIENCLNSIFSNTSVPFEVFVVEGGSQDGSLELAKEKFGNRKEIQLIDLKENAGPTRKRNVGALHSRGKYLVFLDTDTVVDRGWLEEAIVFLEKNDDIGAGQLKILKMGQKDRFDSAGEKLTKSGFLVERARSTRDRGQFDQAENIFSGKTAAMIIKREVFFKAGGFDEDYFMYWEEPDLCWRIWKLGYRVVFLPFGKVWHAFGTENKKVGKPRLVQITYLGCRNHLMTIIKNGVGLRMPQMPLTVPAAWLILSTWFLIKLDLQRAAAVWSAFLWLASNFRFLMRKRGENKKRLGARFYSDKDWFAKIETGKDLNWHLGKGVNYILGRPF